jgi:hypothetical protein
MVISKFPGKGARKWGLTKILQRRRSSLRKNNFSINQEDAVFPDVKSFVNQTSIRIREFGLTWFVNRVFSDSGRIVIVHTKGDRV